MEGRLKPGLKHELQWTAGPEHAATHVGAAPVFSTPAMIALLEIAATEGVQPYLPRGQTTVGIHVDVRHLAATPLGMRVTGRAELIEVEPRVLTFRVMAEDENEVIGEGTHRRAVIDVVRFQAKVAAKAARG
jgi:predicted thioesterase